MTEPETSRPPTVSRRPRSKLAIGIAIVVVSVAEDGVRLAVRDGVGLRFVLVLGLAVAAWRLGLRYVRRARTTRVSE